MLKTPRSLAPRGFQSDLHFRTKRRFGGRDGNRTRTPYNWRRILSPLRLPIPSPGQCQTFEKRSVKNRPFYEFWSGKRGSNSRHQPWQGCTLPTELFPREKEYFTDIFTFCNTSSKIFRPPIPSVPTSRLLGSAWSLPIVYAS